MDAKANICTSMLLAAQTPSDAISREKCERESALSAPPAPFPLHLSPLARVCRISVGSWGARELLCLKPTESKRFLLSKKAKWCLNGVGMAM